MIEVKFPGRICPGRFVERGGAWVVAQFALMGATLALAVLLPGNWQHGLVRFTGWILFMAGGVLGLAGVAVLGPNRTPFPKPREGSELVQRGIYARVRHPLYTSVLLVSFGWAMIWQSWPGLLAALVLVPFFHIKARREERQLREKFSDYADYEQRVARFLPRFRQRKPARHQTNLPC